MSWPGLSRATPRRRMLRRAEDLLWQLSAGSAAPNRTLLAISYLPSAAIVLVMRSICGAYVLPMRIAQLAPLAESVPPKLYVGAERVVDWLVDELVDLGHDVTLFASGDSRTRGILHPVWPHALRLGRTTGRSLSVSS